jgi:hypothetical protein
LLGYWVDDHDFIEMACHALPPYPSIPRFVTAYRPPMI